MREARFRCEAVLFDLDGVLVDSTASVERTWRMWSARHGFDAAEIIKAAHGHKAEDFIRSVAPHLDAAAEVRGLEEIEVEDAPNVPAIAGAAELLASLPPDAWAIVTSGTHPIASARIRHAGLPEPRVLVTAGDVDAGKPDPSCYRLAARRLGAVPERCVVVEDAPAGIRAGRAAGMKVLAVPTTHPPQELCGADAVASALANISAGKPDGGDGRLELSLELPVDPPKRP